MGAALATRTTGSDRRDHAAALDRRLGRRIRQLRMDLHLTQKQLARRLGVTPQQLTKYERGYNRPSVGRLVVIAEALDVEVHRLVLDAARTLPPPATPLPRPALELADNVARIPDHRLRTAVCALARTLAHL